MKSKKFERTGEERNEDFSLNPLVIPCLYVLPRKASARSANSAASNRAKSSGRKLDL
jgi:hypothetical protein